MAGVGLSVERFALSRGVARQIHHDAAAQERFDDTRCDSPRPFAETKTERRFAARIDFDDLLPGGDASATRRQAAENPG